MTNKVMQKSISTMSRVKLRYFSQISLIFIIFAFQVDGNEEWILPMEGPPLIEPHVSKALGAPSVVDFFTIVHSKMVF